MSDHVRPDSYFTNEVSSSRSWKLLNLTVRLPKSSNGSEIEFLTETLEREVPLASNSIAVDKQFAEDSSQFWRVCGYAAPIALKASC